jgi:response regulator RpfG family c-di-GMP phosphodiesterase
MHMNVPGSSIGSGTSERQSRLTFAFVESAIATSAMLQAVLGRLYTNEPDALAHTQRVAQLAVRVGAELGMAERALDNLERAAWLHDLGRFVVPESVSREADLFGADTSLTRGEQAFAAAAIAASVPFLRPAGEIVLASREWFDGSGYPLQLKGPSIPFSARILHVADVYDALTSLCLALAISPDTVNGELVRQSGSRFDPEVVAAWLRCAEGSALCC